jgi:hypothetical protein
MSVLYNPTALLYAVVEYLQQSAHIYDQVDDLPQWEGQYRLVCLTPESERARQIAHLLRAMSSAVHHDRYGYSVCVAEPENQL